MLYVTTADWGPYNKGEIVSFTEAEARGKALAPYVAPEVIEEKQEVPSEDKMLRRYKRK